MSVAVVTDSVACLPQRTIEKFNIVVVPLEIIHKGKVFRDGVDITHAQFYEILRTSDVLPTTTAPPPKAFLDIYENLVEQGKEILVVCPSAKLTHVFTAANVAAERLRDKMPSASIEVLDSGSAAAAQGFVVTDAAETAVCNKMTLIEAMQIAKQAMQEVNVLVYIDTIEYLARSGRVPYILAWANSLLRIKPIIQLMPLGKGVILVDRARTRQRASQRVLEILKEKTRGKPLRVVVQHTNCLEEAEDMAQQIEARLNIERPYIQDFTPVMGVHTGPGLLGVSYSTYGLPDFEK
jgi:DegV family protein with EDD domain